MKILLRGWTRMWVDGGFRGASKKFILIDGTMCNAIIRKGFVAVCCISGANAGNGRLMHLIVKVSAENLARFFAMSDATEIYEIYCLLN